jgi:C2 domain
LIARTEFLFYITYPFIRVGGSQRTLHFIIIIISMKLQLSICAKDLPATISGGGGGGSFYAVVYNEDSSSTLGKTKPTASVTVGSGNNNNNNNNAVVTWSEVVSIEDSEKKVNVVIYDLKNGDDSIVDSAMFDMTEILASSHQAQAKRTRSTAEAAAVTTTVICVHVQPEQVAQLHLVLGAKDLPDTDFGFNIGNSGSIGKQLTDPFFEIYNASNGRKVVRSNVCQDTLNPTWQPITLDLNQFAFGGTMDGKAAAKIKITIYDKDKGDAKEFLGQVECSVEQLVQSSGDTTRGIPLVFNRGTLLIVEAKLLPQQAVSKTAIKAMNVVYSALQMDLGAMAAAQAQATNMAETAKAKQELAATTNAQALVLEKEEQEAAERQGQAQDVVSQLGAKTKKVAEQLAKNGGGPCTGKLVLQLRAENLADLDMGLLNKSDPVYQVYSASDATQQVHRSNIVSDNLNPTWDVSTIDIVKLCQGKLNAPFRIALYDKNGGDDTDFLGHVNNVTVNQLLKASASSQGMTLEKAKRGTLFVVKAELDKFVDLVQQLDELKKEFEKAKSALDQAKASWKTCNEKAEQARQVAVVAQEAADQAHDDAEEAQLSVEMARASLK